MDSATIFGIVILSIMIIGYIIKIFIYRKVGQGTTCQYCNKGEWEYFDTDSSLESGYKCNNCHKTVWK